MPSKYFTTTTARSKGGKSASRTLRWARVGWQNRQKTQSKMKEFIVRINYVLVARRCRLILTLFPLVVETKGQLLHPAETILHVYINCLAVR